MKQKYYLQINYLRLLASIAIIGFASFILFFVCAIYSENGNGSEMGFYISRALFLFFNFPVAFLSNALGWMGLVMGMLSGTIFYGLLIEFVFVAVLQKKVKHNYLF